MNEVFLMSPRSGLTKIAQRFIAGIGSSYQPEPALAGDSLFRSNREIAAVDFGRPFHGLCLVSADYPSTKVLGYYRWSASRTQSENFMNCPG